jgi:hypothetical protein
LILKGHIFDPTTLIEPPASWRCKSGGARSSRNLFHSSAFGVPAHRQSTDRAAGAQRQNSPSLDSDLPERTNMRHP